MAGFLKRTNKERRRVRWSTTSKTTLTFIYTVITIAIFTSVIVLFSWGVSALISALGG